MRSILARTRELLHWRWKLCRIHFLSLFYNDHLNGDYVFDTVMQPAFWFVDHCTAAVGPVFVAVVMFLTSSVVFIAYWVGLPYYVENKSWGLLYTLVLLGHYLLINVIFHFFRAWLTSPGHPPTDRELEQVTTICKKCIAPKPPRTHHCSVCNACVLKMDHHCPWLNNCVGHFNHRHFFLYMVFTVTGCAFIMMFGFEIFMEEFVDHWWGGAEDVQLATRYPGQSFGVFTRRSLVFYEAFMTSATFVALGGLAAWHARLITAGQTSIEAHINRSETKRLAEQGKLYRNPYNFGPLHNWFLFLGVVDGRGWSSVLLPSSHTPPGDGLTWNSVYSCNINWTYGAGKQTRVQTMNH